MAFAEDSTLSGADGTALMAAGLCITIAAVGGALGGGALLPRLLRASPATRRLGQGLRPILGLALIESLVIYALLIAFTIAGESAKRTSRLR